MSTASLEGVVGSPLPSDRSPSSTLCLDSSEFLGVCREALGRGVVVCFEAHGLSMRPALKPGDVLCAEPLAGCVPEVGEIVLFENAVGRPVVHRVVGRRRGRSGWLLITSGDGHPLGSLEAVLPLERVLGRVRSCERQGVRIPLEPRRPGLWVGLRATWALFSAEHKGLACVVQPVLSALRRIGRRLGGALLRWLHVVRRWPVLGHLARAAWPDLTGRCHIEVTAVPRGAGPTFVVDAIFRGRSVGRVSLHKGYVGEVSPEEWWLSGEYVEPLYRRRGVATAVLTEALNLAQREGAKEVRIATATSNKPNLALLTRLGFTVETDPTRARQLNAYFQSINPHALPVVVLRRGL